MRNAVHLNYVQAAAEEFQASREAVTLCDYSSFAKMDLWSAGTEVSRGIYKFSKIVCLREIFHLFCENVCKCLRLLR